MSTDKSRKILARRRHVLSREQREGKRQRARVNTRRASEDERQRDRVRRRRRRQNFSEESQQVERVRARRRRENYSEKRLQAERDRARMNRQRQREREIKRQRERQQNNDMMTESAVLMSLWPLAINILISNWSWTRKFSQSFKKTETDRGFSLFSTQSRVHHALRPFNFYALIGQKLTGEFMQKIYTASWNLFTLTADADRVFRQLMMFFTVFFHWMHKMKYSCYQQSSVIHGWFVHWIFGWEMRGLSKLEIIFRMTSFSFFTLLDADWKVPQAILALLDSF